MLYDLFLKPYECDSTLFIVFRSHRLPSSAFRSAYGSPAGTASGYIPPASTATALYVYILFVSGVYGDAVINIYYTAMSLYGWYVWLNVKGEGQVLPITRLHRRGALFTGGFTLANFALFYIILQYYTDSIVPTLDAITTSLAFSAMYLMARKKVENWAFWIAWRPHLGRAVHLQGPRSNRPAIPHLPHPGHIGAFRMGTPIP